MDFKIIIGILLICIGSCFILGSYNSFSKKRSKNLIRFTFLMALGGGFMALGITVIGFS